MIKFIMIESLANRICLFIFFNVFFWRLVVLMQKLVVEFYNSGRVREVDGDK